MPQVEFHMKNGEFVLGKEPERIFDYHNNDLVADLDHFLKDPLTGLYTDWEVLNRVAEIVAKRKAPSSEMTDCQTGLCYQNRSSSLFQQAMEIAKRNAGKEQS